MTLLQAWKAETNVAYTENGAKAYGTTNSALVDLFAQGGAMRTRSEQDIVGAFTRAFAEDALLAMKMLFYFRDVRGGQGERRLFRTIIRYMANAHTATMKKNIHLIPEYGRWDDLYELDGTALEAEAYNLMRNQFEYDLKSPTPSLMAKWLKSENTSSLESRRLARKTSRRFGFSDRRYRKALSKLRATIRVVEARMSAKEWSKIDYSGVPSLAAMKYREAFRRNDTERYEHYLESLKKGEETINASTLYPYDIVSKITDGWRGNHDETLEQLWKALPDYIERDEDSIAVVDVSGSMSGLPMDVAVSLGLYLAERNKGLYHNHFITFSERPQLVKVEGSNLHERVRNIRSANWGYNTNVEAVFDLVLNAAIKNKIDQSEMVKKLYIITDMEFDAANRTGRKKHLFQNIKDKFTVAGYEMPQLVFWNVNARQTQFPMTTDENGVAMVSGCSPVIFKSLMQDKMLTPYDLMQDVLNAERYNAVTV